MTIRLLRGQVVVRETKPEYSKILYVPDANPREQKIHRGRVIAKGPPALLWAHEAPQEFEVGDDVLYFFTHHEAAWTREWSDGHLATWIPQQNVAAVLE